MDPLRLHPRWFKATRGHLDAARPLVGRFMDVYSMIHSYYAGFAARPMFVGELPKHGVPPTMPDAAFPELRRLVSLINGNGSPEEIEAEVRDLRGFISASGKNEAAYLAEITRALDSQEGGIRHTEESLRLMKEAKGRMQEFMAKRPSVADPARPTPDEVRTQLKWFSDLRKMVLVHDPKLEDETSVTHSWLVWETTGSNTFVLSAELTDMLHNTDVGDVRASDILLPYDSLYLSFGKRGVEHYPGRPDVGLDGAYVTWMDAPLNIGIADIKSLGLVLTGSPPGPPPSVSSVVDDASRPTITVVLNFVNAQADGEELHTSSAFLDFRSRAAGRDVAITYGDLTTLARGEGPEAEEARYIDEGIRLALNALSYMTLDDREERAGYAEEAGERDAKRAESMSGRQRKQELDRIARRGYTVVRFLGNHNPVKTGGHTDREVRAHWRRGHWRRQRFGVARSESRRLWIRPTVVRRDAGEPTIGHDYIVDERKATTDAQ